LLGLVEGQHAPEIEVDESIAIEDEELFLEVRKSINQGAGCAARACLLEAADAHAEFAAVSEMVADNISAVVDKKQDIIDALVTK
jgi:hypothetical protein